MAKSFASISHPTYAVQRNTELKELPSIDLFNKCNYIIVPSSYIGELLEKLKCPELKPLVLENIDDQCLKVPDKIFSGMREVRVLILHGMVLTPFPPSSLDILINLCSLSLCRLTLEDTSMVAKLTNLEILIFKQSSIEEPIPTHSFPKLKVIKVKRCHGSKNLLLYSLARELSELHEMHISNSTDMSEIIANEKLEDEKYVPKIVLSDLHSLTLQRLLNYEFRLATNS